jgi:hypothetical protein
MRMNIGGRERSVKGLQPHVTAPCEQLKSW